MGWAANPTRKSESLFSLSIIQMGARVYLPTLGRFLQVDPIEGGTDNAYAYVNDPVNDQDYNGLFAWKSFFKKAAVVAIAVIAVVAVVVATCATGICEAAGLAAAATAVSAAVSRVATRIAPTINRASSTAAKAGQRAAPAVQKAAPAAEKASRPVVQLQIVKFVDQGRNMVSSQGFQMTEYYYNRLTESGRADFATRATNILNNAQSKTPDPQGFDGFYKYTYDGWELIYNPSTQEISHLSRN